MPAVTEYRKKLLQHKELESRVRIARENLKTSKKEFNKPEDDLKSLQSVAQIIGEVLRPLDNERLIVKASNGPRYVVGCRSKVDKEKLTYVVGCRSKVDKEKLTYVVGCRSKVDKEKLTYVVGCRSKVDKEKLTYVVGCRSKVDKEKLTSCTRVVLDMTTLTIMRALPREISRSVEEA